MEIIATILQTATQGVTKTRMMYAAYLSYQQINDYLEFLLGNDLLQCEKETDLYRVTEKGLRFLSSSSELNELISFKNSELNDPFDR